jgi:hypothetical protein
MSRITEASIRRLLHRTSHTPHVTVCGLKKAADDGTVEDMNGECELQWACWYDLSQRGRVYRGIQQGHKPEKEEV